MNPRLIRLVLTVSVIGCVVSVRAEDAIPKAPAYVLKNKSVFTVTVDEQRAPFWPIGWVKRKPMQASAATVHVEVPKVVLDPKNFKVSSILLGDPSLAIINGRTYSEGEFLRTPKAAGVVAVAPAPRIRVYRINDGSVVLQCQEQLLPIALQRPELVQRNTVEDLLTEDRP